MAIARGFVAPGGIDLAFVPAFQIPLINTLFKNVSS
ncbi:hypothetical protein ACT453_62180 [Bacillus sp. D-CC]